MVRFGTVLNRFLRARFRGKRLPLTAVVSIQLSSSFSLRLVRHKFLVFPSLVSLSMRFLFSAFVALAVFPAVFLADRNSPILEGRAHILNRRQGEASQAASGSQAGDADPDAPSATVKRGRCTAELGPVAQRFHYCTNRPETVIDIPLADLEQATCFPQKYKDFFSAQFGVSFWPMDFLKLPNDAGMMAATCYVGSASTGMLTYIGCCVREYQGKGYLRLYGPPSYQTRAGGAKKWWDERHDPTAFYLPSC